MDSRPAAPKPWETAGAADPRPWIERRVAELGDWFHNFDLLGVPTAPHHFLGDYPAQKWRQVETGLPPRLDGLSVLDVGCNAGFHALACKRRGAATVLGIDVDERYLAQARLATAVLGLEVEWRRLSVYAAPRLQRRFDYVLFLGLFYHLRYPLYALDALLPLVGGKLVFQTMVRGESPVAAAPDYDFWDSTPFAQPGFPCMYFIERSFASDPTNWWIPNAAAVEALLRSAGLRICAHPEAETWICEPLAPAPAASQSVWERELDGTL